MNYSMMLKQLQLGYMVVTMKDVNDGDQCTLCWKSGCCCGSYSVKEDSFINLTAEELQHV